MNETDLQILSEYGIPRVEGGYGTIVADPPWSFSDRGTRAAPDAIGDTIYETMPADQIYRLPVDLIAAPSSHLYLWTTDSHLPLALNSMRAWGFLYRKCLVWVKRRCVTAPVTAEGYEDGAIVRGPLQMGMGHWYRSAKEICLFGVRGSCPANTHDLVDVIEYPRTQHSRKPDTLLEWAEKMSPGPRIELFARRSREGWAGWGDQFPGHDPHLREIAKRYEHRRGDRSASKAKKARRVSTALRRAEEFQIGTSQWPSRCSWCAADIAAGDQLAYLVDDTIHLCGLCLQEVQDTIRAQETQEVSEDQTPF